MNSDGSTEDHRRGRLALDLDGWDVVPWDEHGVIRQRNGVLLQLDFHDFAPDLPSGLDDLEPIRAQFAAMAPSSGGAIVDIDTIDVDGHRSLRTIAKAWRDEDPRSRGFAFFGVIQVHLPMCWWSVATRSREEGTTGIREALVVNELLARGSTFEQIFGHPLREAGPEGTRKSPVRPVVDNRRNRDPSTAEVQRSQHRLLPSARRRHASLQR